MQVLSDVRNDGVLLCKIALCRGLYVHQGEVLEPIIAADFEFVQRFLHKRHAFSPVEPRNERDRTPFCSEQSDLEAITSYAQSEKLKTFFIDETPPAEYQIDVAAGPTTCRKTGRIGTSMIDRRGRPRIMLPFTPFGQMICTRPESPNGIYWCFDLLRSGYSSVHELTLSGPRKTSVTRQLTRNLLGRMGLNYLLPTNSSAPSPHSALERLVRSCSPTYGPIPGRILMVTSTFALGGSERQAIAVASALMRRGYDVRLMALGPLEPDAPTVEEEIVRLGLQPLTPGDFAQNASGSDGTPNMREWSELPTWFTKKARAVELAIRQIRPSILHGWLDIPALAAAVTGCRLGVPRIVIAQASLPQHVNSFGAEAADLVWDAYQAVIRNPAVKIVNNSVAAARSYERWLRFRPGTIEVLPNCFWSQHMRVPAAEESSEPDFLSAERPHLPSFDA